MQRRIPLAKIKGERKSGPRTETVYTITATTKYDRAAMALLTGRPKVVFSGKEKEALRPTQRAVNALAHRLEDMAGQRHIEVRADGHVTRFTDKLKTLGF